MRALVAFCLTANIVACASAFAQSPGDAPAQAAQEATAPTLHVFTDLVQVPTLVLGQDQKPIAAIDEHRFFVSFDGGPKFPVTHARLEGDDPLSVAILLDKTQSDPKILTAAAQAIASLAPLSLTAKDTVSIYVMDCQVLQAPEGPTDAATLKHNVDLLLGQSQSRGEPARCQNPASLLDTLAELVQTLSIQPGRRVILALTDGVDRGSHLSWNELAHFAQSKSVAIFGLAAPPPFDTSHQLQNANLRIPQARVAQVALPFGSVCQSSGGWMLGASQDALGAQLAKAVTLIRGRYILEFPRPLSTVGGRHHMEITIAKSDAFIRPAGASFPTVDAATLKDPTTILSDPTHAPRIGKGKPLPPQQNAVASAPETTQPPAVAPAAIPPPSTVSSTIAGAPTPAAAPSPSPTLTPRQTAALSSSPSLASRETASGKTASGEITLKVSSRLTLVDVTVSDSKGHPVHGLTPADFTIKEDGKSQPLKNFEEFGAETIAAATISPVPPNVSANQPASPPTSHAAVNILLFDQIATGITRGLQPSPEALKQAKTAALSYLKTMPADTQAAILAMDGTGLHLVQGFTSDHELLSAAVNSIAYQLVPESYWTPEPMSRPLLCNAMNFQSAQTLNGLNHATAFVSSILGRKNLLWFTPGVPWLTYYAPFSAIDCLSDFTPQLQEVYGRLTAARVALYPIDPRGLYNDPAFSGETQGRAGMIVPGYSTRTDTESLEAFAKATGGKAYYDRNNLDAAMRDATATGAEYYALSYVPPISKYDGKYHTIKVTVDRPGLQLQYRQGYTSLDPAKVPAVPSAASSH